MHSVAAHGWRLVVSVVLAAILVLGVIANDPVSVQGAEKVLSPEAEKAMQLGLAAAKQQEWELAVKYFSEARDAAKIGKYDYSGIPPMLVFNLALALDKAGGRELLAAVHFKAYLAVAPNADNASQVRTRIDELIVKYEANIWKLIKNAEEIMLNAPALTANDRITARTETFHDALEPLAEARTYMEDAAGAKQMLKRLIYFDSPGSTGYAIKAAYERTDRVQKRKSEFSLKNHNPSRNDWAYYWLFYQTHWWEEPGPLFGVEEKTVSPVTDLEKFLSRALNPSTKEKFAEYYKGFKEASIMHDLARGASRMANAFFEYRSLEQFERKHRAAQEKKQ